MNDRPTASTITDAQLDELHERLDKAEQEITATATAAAHMTSLILDRAEQAEARLAHLQATSEAAGNLLTRTTDERDRLAATLSEVLATFGVFGNGPDYVRSCVVRSGQITEWRAALAPPKEQP